MAAAMADAPTRRDDGWRETLLVALGAFGGFVALLFFILWAQADGPYETSTDADVAVPLALLAAGGLALARRKPTARLPWAGAAALLAFFALFALHWWAAAAAVLAASAAFLVARGSTSLRAAALVPLLWATALLVATAAEQAPGFAAYSGLAILLLGLGYPVAWAWVEPARWARRLAWGAALGWSVLGASVAAADLAAFRDPLTVASAAVAGLAVVGVAVAGALRSRLGTPGQRGGCGPMAG